MIQGMKDYNVMVPKTKIDAIFEDGEEKEKKSTCYIPAVLLIDPMGPIPPIEGRLKIRAGFEIKKNLPYCIIYQTNNALDDGTKVRYITLKRALENGGKKHEQLLEVNLHY